MSPTWAREVGFVPTALPRDQLSQGWGIPCPDSTLKRCRVLGDSPSPPPFSCSSIPEPA